jgi:hypothetical protein
MGDKNVYVGGNMIGGAAVTGDHNVTTVTYRKVTLPPPDSIDIRAELAALKDLLIGLDTEDRQKIANALGEAESDAAKQHPDKNEIGGALERALGYAGKAADFGGEGRQDRCTRTERRRLARRPLSQAVAAGRPRRVGAGDGRAQRYHRPGCARQRDRHRRQ